MQFFVDTADINAIKDLAEMGIVDGVTTNPTLIAKEGRDLIKTIQEIAAMVDGPVSAEVTAVDYKEMITQGHKLSKISPNIAVKVPLTADGLKACRALSNEGIMVNVTLCFHPGQALLAAKAGATFVSPFVGRLDDIGQDGMNLIQEIREIYDNYSQIDTEILAASIRHPMHIVDAARMGADICTVPPEILKKLVNHPLTSIGLDAFLKDIASTNQVI
jgi:transaldolase